MRKTIYINDDLILNRLSQEKNQSRYISDLIMKDIVGETFATEERVLQIIKQYFSTLNFQSVTTPNNTYAPQVSTNELKDSILSVLNCED